MFRNGIRGRGLGCALALSIIALLAAPAVAAARFTARGSAEQVDVTGLGSGAAASLESGSGRVIATTRADALGGLLFRGVRPGTGYRVRAGRTRSGPLRVLSNASAPPSSRIYNRTIPASGYGYLTTRDGTKLAIDVHPPINVKSSPGAGKADLPAVPVKYPTLVEYSGYGYADPSGPQSGIATVANLMGFAVVDVNMRGTGCSGGAFDFFEALQNLDGYDVIETVARQPWVLHHKVGMMGISYGGISQLFTAQTDPPSLAAIAPLSVIDQTRTTLYPGGILNTGFALPWAQERVHDALPATPSGGQRWAYERIRQGDATCRANQALHGEAVNLLRKVRADSHYVPAVDDPVAPTTFAHRIKVPVFLACQWNDEQTGGHCADLAEHMTGTRRKWFTFTNGDHIDSLDPRTFNRWYDFLQLYVAHQAPIVMSAVVRASAPLVYRAAMGINGVSLPSDPIQRQPTYRRALAAFEALPSVRVLFDSGAGGQPGSPYPGFEHSWSRFPIPGTIARNWYLRADGQLRSRAPAQAGVDAFTWNARARPLTDFTGGTDGAPGDLWTASPVYHWLQPPRGSAVSYLTAPLAASTTVIGAGALHLWIRSSAPNVDLQATLSEVRRDGHETYVQSGWLRGDERALDPRTSTVLEPVLSLRRDDVSRLPPRRFVEVTIPLYYEGHAYRAGSRIRVTISAPGGDQPIWAFAETSPRGRTIVALGRSRAMPSRLVLPVVPGVSVPTGLPPCPGLRGEPCRRYQPLVNRRLSR